MPGCWDDIQATLVEEFALFVIEPAHSDEWLSALHLALHQLPDEQRHGQVIHLLHLVDEGTLDPAGILVARQEQQLIGVQVCVPLQGGTVLFWLPVIRSGHESTGLSERLVQAGLDWGRQRGCRLAQAFLEPAELDRAGPLLRHGFVHLTRLLYLHHDLEFLEPAARTLHGEPCTSANENTFRATLLRTYEGTLDCPELNGLRSVEDILAGYRAAGPARPDLWWLLYAEDQPAAVAILTELPEGPAWDLSYLGVMPEQRRRGLGRAIVQQVLWTARRAGVQQVLVAVDERNSPARRLYQSLGFIEGEAREVLLRIEP